MRIGTTVLYRLSASDVDLITIRRTTAASVSNRAQRNPPEWPAGAVAAIGDPVVVGELVPLIVTRETPTGDVVSGHALLNGSDTFWVGAAAFVVDEPAQPGEATTLSAQMSQEVQQEIAQDRKARAR